MDLSVHINFSIQIGEQKHSQLIYSMVGCTLFHFYLLDWPYAYNTRMSNDLNLFTRENDVSLNTTLLNMDWNFARNLISLSLCRLCLFENTHLIHLITKLVAWFTVMVMLYYPHFDILICDSADVDGRMGCFMQAENRVFSQFTTKGIKELDL